ncbi:MAG: hypothetical protein ABSB15_04605 [Bryobacteraceae bacterium]|jgi:hypothetical protein
MKQVFFCVLICGCASLPANASAHPDFTGNWQFDTAKSEVHTKAPPSSWDIRQTDDSISISEQLQGKTESMTCEISPRACKTKVDGKSAEVSFYFNGDMLVETDLLGRGKDRVVKKRLKLAADGKTLEIEVMHISPVAPAEKWVFEKR